MSAESVRSVLFLHAGALGDFLLTLHVVAAVRRRFPNAAAHVAARCPLADWARRRGVLDGVHDPDACNLHRLYADDPPPEGEPGNFLRSFDWLISFLGGPDATVSRNLIRVGAARVFAVDPKPSARTVRSGNHITRQWLDDLAAQGLPLDGVHDPAAPLFGPIPSRARSGVVIVHPGSGGRSKCCPLPILEGVVRELGRRGWGVSWMIGPVEMELHGADYAARLESTAPVIHEPSLPAAADVVAEADVFIGQDAGMTHLAAACGLRTVALHGPTNPRVWRPLGPQVETIQLDFETAGEDTDTLVRRIGDALLLSE